MHQPERQIRWTEQVNSPSSRNREGKNLLKAATYNIMNVNALTGDPDPSNNDRLDKLARSIIEDLDSPHLIALQEVQDNNGPENDGDTSASDTLQVLVDAITAQGGPRYAYTQIDPINNKDGGQPGSNIRQAFLYDADRLEVREAKHGKGKADESCEILSDKDGVHLSHNPARIKPDHHSFERSRKPLVAEFVDKLSGKSLFAINVHLISKRAGSKGSDQKRTEQAQIIADFADELDDKLDQAGQEKAYMIMGDYNSMPHETPVRILADGEKRENLAQGLDDGSYYTYIHRGNKIAIDHVVASIDLDAPEGAHAVIINTNQPHRKRPSDHNPVRTDVWLRRQQLGEEASPSL